jgi:hypothetical protein
MTATETRSIVSRIHAEKFCGAKADLGTAMDPRCGVEREGTRTTTGRMRERTRFPGPRREDSPRRVDRENLENRLTAVDARNANGPERGRVQGAIEAISAAGQITQGDGHGKRSAVIVGAETGAPGTISTNSSLRSRRERSQSPMTAKLSAATSSEVTRG